jgi:hypothetical protein
MKAIKNEWKIGNKKSKEELLARKDKEMKIKIKGCEDNHTRRKHKKNEKGEKRQRGHK